MPADSESIPPLDIRAASPADAAVLADLIAQFSGPQGDAEETAARLVACTGLEVALIAWIGSEAVGFACLRVTPAIGSRTPHALLTELYVGESYRQRGVGRALVERAESLACQQGAPDLYLFTGGQNLTAQRFYAALGYTTRGVTLYKPIGQ
jgi:glucosamine-phosphate N-acetyltransferase